MFSITKILAGLRLSVTGSATPASLDITPGGTDNTVTTLSAAQTADRTITLPDRSGEVALTSGSQTLTGTTIDGDDNTLLDISIASLKAVPGDANEVLVRDGAGNVVSAPLVNANVDAAAGIEYSKLDLAASIVDADIAPGANIDATKLEADAFDVIAPSTTKGDIIVHNGTDNVRLPVGTNGFVPFADSTQATGIRWDSVAAGSLDINGLTQETVVAPTADFLPMYDASAGANRKVTPSDLTNINNFTTETTVAQASDFLLMYDASATANRKVTVQNIIKAGTNPTIQKFTSGTSLTYTTPAGVKYIHVEMVGGGGGGSGGSDTGGAGGAGGATSFSTFTAGGGSGGTTSSVGQGGSASVPTNGSAFAGTSGHYGSYQPVSGAPFSYWHGGHGGDSYFGGGGFGGHSSGGAAGAGSANSGSGGGAGGGTANQLLGKGGGSGAYLETFIYSPAASYTYTVGTGGAGGTAGAGFAGGAGAAGFIKVTEYYQ